MPETVRLDISSWYLSEHAISIAIANRFAAGVPVRIIGDRGAIFEADPHTKTQFYWLASQGDADPAAAFNPTWFPEIVHWKAAIFVGQNVVEFGIGELRAYRARADLVARTTPTSPRCSRTTRRSSTRSRRSST